MQNTKHALGNIERIRREKPYVMTEEQLERAIKEAERIEKEERKAGKKGKLGEEPTIKTPIQIIDAPTLDEFIYFPSLGIYLGKKRELNGLNWNQAIDKIYNQGIEINGIKAEMPTPFEFMTCLNYLLSNKNIKGVTKREKKNILNDILKKGDYRGNHLNVKFVEDANGFNSLGIETATFDFSGKLVKKTAPLEKCLNENCYADINSINNQGLLTQKSSNQNYEQGKNAYFWVPSKGAVARFNAYSGRVGFYCLRDPSGGNSSLGVRLVIRPKGVSPKI